MHTGKRLREKSRNVSDMIKKKNKGRTVPEPSIEKPHATTALWIPTVGEHATVTQGPS